MKSYEQEMLACVTHSSIDSFANLLHIRNNGLITYDELPMKDTRQIFAGKYIIQNSNTFEAYPVEMSVEQNANAVTGSPS
jgi:hypothetical protein